MLRKTSAVLMNDEKKLLAHAPDWELVVLEHGSVGAVLVQVLVEPTISLGGHEVELSCVLVCGVGVEFRGGRACAAEEYPTKEHTAKISVLSSR